MPAVFNDTSQLQLIDQIPSCIYLCHASGQCRYTNSALQTMFGLSAEECAGYGWMKSLHPDDSKLVHEQWLQALRTQADFELSFRILPPDQDIRYVRAKTRPLWDAHGQISGYIGSIEDITFEHSPLKHSLHLIEISPIPHVLFNAQGEIVYLNPAFSNSFGYVEADLPQLSRWWKQAFPDLARWQEGNAQNIQVAPLTTDPVSPASELQISCKNGGFKAVKASQTLLTLGQEKAQLITLIDLSELYQQKSDLQEQAQRYRQLFDKADLSIWNQDMTALLTHLTALREAGITDLAAYLEETPSSLLNMISMFKVIDINPATLALFEGTSKAEFMQGFASLFGESALTVIRQELLAFWRKDTIFRSEINLKTLQGRSFQALISYPIPATEEEACIVPVSIQDISELKESESRWQFAIEGSGDGLWDWDISSNTIFYSRRWKEMLGFTDEDINNTYQEWEKRVHPADWPKVINKVKAHLKGDTPFFSNEYRIRSKEGNWKWIVDRGMVVCRDEKGLPLRVIGTHHDITERKNNENALLANRAQLAGMIDSAMDAIVTTDAEFNIILFNQAAENMFGYPAQQMLGCPIEVLIPVKLAAQHREQMHKFGGQGEGHRKMGGSSARQVMGKRADGNEFPIEVAISYLDNFGSPIYTAMVRNITDRLAYETSLLQLTTTLEQRVIERTYELEAAKQQAENANLAKSAFLANMSHEIRTPLNSVLGMAHLAQLTPLNTKQSDYLQKITLSANHLLDLINDILDFSKIEAGKMEISSHDFSLHELIDHVRELIQQKAEEKGLQLHIVIGIQVPSFLQGDDLRIKQVLINLLSNAIKFTQDGKITLTVSLDSNENVAFSVCDTGIGIPVCAQAQLFQSFQQADNSITRKYGGTGLGLAISSQLVQLMGGELTVTSQPGQGSEFKFSLSLPKINALAPSPAHQNHSISDHFLAGKHILLADDHPFNQQIGAELLQIAGAEVVIANNGLEILQLAKQHHFDAILMDVQMPQMDGITASLALRKMPAFDPVPIIAMTANVSREYRQNCLNAGMNDFIGKPVQAEKIYQTLAYWLGPQATKLPAINRPQPEAELPRPEEASQTGSASSESGQIIDFSELRSMLGDDADRQRKYCAKFAQSFEEGLASILYLHESKSLIGPECHRLKSIARTVGAMPLGLQLASMEKLDQSTPSDVQSEKIRQLKSLFQQSCEVLQKNGLLDGAGSPNPVATSVLENSPLCILLVDDDRFILEIIQQHLNDLGITQILSFLKAEDALKRLALPPQPDWIFCDLQMPDMDGVAFLRQLGLLQYEGYIAILSAMDKQVLKAAERLAHSFHLKLGGSLTKPVKKEELAQILLLHPAHSGTEHTGSHMPQLQLLEDEIRNGLAAGEVELYYQPKVSTNGRGVLGAESLARWRHPLRGLLGPHLFVPAIEALGLIDDLTLCVLRLASRQLRIWLDQGEHIKLSINVSMGNLHRLELPELFQEVLRESNISPELITLEITETQLTHDYVLSLDILTRLRIMGFGLSVDDFGTGFSTMEHLIQIPFTELKIDKTFVSGATSDASARTILEHSADLGRKFSLNLVAEGVETQADWDLVSNMGCHEVQGYLIGHPMPATEFIHWKKMWESHLSSVK
ncbi:EAL domain-containing protein [Iodobacter sp. HSC-16F04]|uniref:histidine kinase n=1 Tax=Iodobacter violaceini TaxID=3044271 RepID=A0ABX0KT15_9NEIS|nr:EAL domain-containing protein [Iodobacter violacea]NHQ87805.1 EAL domain-containing protein [Iodobacter violacea]